MANPFFDIEKFLIASLPWIEERLLIEEGLSVRVGVDAQGELTKRMLPYEDQVARDLSSGRMTLPELRMVLQSVVKMAALLSSSTLLDRGAIVRAMEKECRYLGWC